MGTYCADPVQNVNSFECFLPWMPTRKFSEDVFCSPKIVGCLQQVSSSLIVYSKKLHEFARHLFPLVSEKWKPFNFEKDGTDKKSVFYNAKIPNKTLTNKANGVIFLLVIMVCKFIKWTDVLTSEVVLSSFPAQTTDLWAEKRNPVIWHRIKIEIILYGFPG